VLNTENNILSYAGAFNPLLIVRDNKIIEYKATRNPIGFYINEQDFENNIIQLKEDDILYIFSDGYSDQFGGDKNRKLRSKKFKELLLESSYLPLNKQNDYLVDFLNSWKGNNEQIDDILIIGVKV
jgi:serine phosphatase RsbU (regulator of sigma subunit)